MPIGWLRAYAEMLPRLRDEEALRMVAVVSAGTGSMVDTDRDALLSLLRSTQPRPARPERPRMTLEELQAIPGMSVTVVPVG